VQNRQVNGRLKQSSNPLVAFPIRPQMKSGAVGVCAPNTECKIIDLETGRASGTNKRGELCVRGPQVMKGT